MAKEIVFSPSLLALPKPTQDMMTSFIESGLRTTSYKRIYFADLGGKYFYPSSGELNKALGVNIVEGEIDEHFKNSLVFLLGAELNYSLPASLQPYTVSTRTIRETWPPFLAGTESYRSEEFTRFENRRMSDHGGRVMTFGEFAINRVGRVITTDISIIQNPAIAESDFTLFCFMDWLISRFVGGHPEPIRVTSKHNDEINKTIGRIAYAGAKYRHDRAVTRYEDAYAVLNSAISELAAVESLLRTKLITEQVDIDEITAIRGISHVNFNGDILVFNTKPLIISLPNGDIPIGTYTLKVMLGEMYTLNPGDSADSTSFIVETMELPKARTYRHPYISSSGANCYGGYAPTIFGAVRQRDLKTLILSTIEWLQSYKPDNPFVHIKNFLLGSLGILLIEDESLLFATPVNQERVEVIDMPVAEEEEEIEVNVDDFIEVPRHEDE